MLYKIDGVSELKAVIGLGALLLHGLNLYISENYIKSYTEYIDAESLRTVVINSRYVASLEDNIVWCLLNSDRFPPLISMATMMYVTRKIDIRYMLTMGFKFGCLSTIKKYISYIHHIMLNGYNIEELTNIIDIYFKVSSRYLETHKGVEKYILDNVNEFKSLTPHHVVMEAWKQMRVEEYV